MPLLALYTFCLEVSQIGTRMKKNVWLFIMLTATERYTVTVSMCAP